MTRRALHPVVLLLSVALILGGGSCKQWNRTGHAGTHPGKGNGHTGRHPSGGGGGNTGGSTGSGTAASGTGYYTELNMKLSAAPFATSNRFAGAVPYGSADNCTFDIVLPTGPGPAPLVILIHGGGFKLGTGAAYYKRFPTEMDQLLKAGFGVATINYRFIPDGPNGVMNSLADSRRCLQFIRYHAAEFGVDKNRIGLLGTSAGAGTSVWLGTHDDMADPNSSDPVARESTRVSAVCAINPQCSYDILSWDAIFGPAFNIRPSEDPKMQADMTEFYGLRSFSEVYTPEMVAVRADIDMPRLIDKSDAPMWLNCDKPNKAPKDKGLLLHHPLHVEVLAEAATKAGVEVDAAAAGMAPVGREETFVEFFLRELK